MEESQSDLKTWWAVGVMILQLIAAQPQPYWRNPLLRLWEQLASSAVVWVYWLCSCTVSLSLHSGVLPRLWVQIYLTTMKRGVRTANIGHSQQSKESQDMKSEIIHKNCFLATISCGLHKTKVEFLKSLHFIYLIFVFHLISEQPLKDGFLSKKQEVTIPKG